MDQEESVQFQILRAIRRIIRRTSEHSRSIGRRSGITVPQMLCMNAIAATGSENEATVATIAQTVQLSAPTTSRILDRLEKYGYIKRERGSSDRRKVYVSLTDQGRARLQELPTPLHEEFVQRLDALDSAEQKSLLKSLEQIVRMMDAENLDASPMLTPEIEVSSEDTSREI